MKEVGHNPKRKSRKLYFLAVFLLAGCSEAAPSVFEPAGPAAAVIAWLGWVFIVLGTLIFLGTMGYLLYALARRRAPGENREGGTKIVIAAGLAMPAVLLLVLFVLNTNVLSQVLAPGEGQAKLTIDVTRHQWWWEVSYPAQQFSTANEIHIPVGQPVLLTPQARNTTFYDGRPPCCGKATCVPICPNGAKYDAAIHAAKAEALGAEIRENSVAFQVEVGSGGKITGVRYKRPDGSEQRVTGRIYMIAANAIETAKLLLISRTDALPNGVANRSFGAQPAPSPSNQEGQRHFPWPLASGLLLILVVFKVFAPLGRQQARPQVIVVPGGNVKAGRQAIRAWGCGSCHTIPGIAGKYGKVGPRLNQMAEQTYIAGILPNTPSNLMNWIMKPQEIPPGNAMPSTGVGEEVARDMAAYLYSIR